MFKTKKRDYMKNKKLKQVFGLLPKILILCYNNNAFQTEVAKLSKS